MRVLVTGGAGYIGSVVAERLVARGDSVVVYDNLLTGHLPAIPPGATFVRGDIADPSVLRPTLRAHGIEAVGPDAPDRAEVQAIQAPLARGEWLDEYQDRLLRVVDRHASLDAVVLGCTELPLAMKPEACALPVLDTVRIQCERAFDWAVDGRAPTTSTSTY